MCKQENKIVTGVNNLVAVLEQHSLQIIFPDKIIAYLGEGGW